MDSYGNYNRNMNGRCGCGGNMGARYANNDSFANRNRMEKRDKMEKVKEMKEMKEKTSMMRKLDRPVGMAYIPMQTFGEMYDACKGLKEGTMFPELNLIFCGVRGN